MGELTFVKAVTIIKFVISQDIHKYVTIIDILDIVHHPFFIYFFYYYYLKQRFKDCTLPPSSDKKPTQLGPFDRASPYLQTPETTQGMV
jgi:hypothetical protein